MDEILFTYFRGEATLDEKQVIEAWLNADPIEHGKQFKAARFVFEGSVLYDQDHRANRHIPQMKTLWRISRYAAAVAAVLLLVVGVRFWGQKTTYDELSSQLTVLEVPAGQRIKITLSDGSQVWLNSMTRIEYPVVFQKNERRVKLSGEALFEVTHRAAQPFVVETFATEVEVLGTKFNVVADDVDHTFRAMLLQGLVRVVNRLNDQSAIVMKPHETVNLVGEQLCLDQTPQTTALCWLDGQVSIDGLTFEQLMSKFEKAFGVKIVIRNAKKLDTGFTRGKVRISDGIDHALKVLQYGADFTYEKDDRNNTIVIL